MIKIFSLLLMSLFFWSSMHLHSMQDASNNNYPTIVDAYKRIVKERKPSNLLKGFPASKEMDGPNSFLAGGLPNPKRKNILGGIGSLIHGIYSVYNVYQVSKDIYEVIGYYFILKKIKRELLKKHSSLEGRIVLLNDISTIEKSAMECLSTTVSSTIASLSEAAGMKPLELFIKLCPKVERAGCRSIFDYKIIYMNPYLLKEKLQVLRDTLAHELIHLKYNDSLKRRVGCIIIPLLVITSVYGIPKIIDKYYKNEDPNNFWNKIKRYLKSPLAIVATPLISYYLIKLFNEYQEIRCDLGAAFLCQSAKGGIEDYNYLWGRMGMSEKLDYSIGNFFFGDHPHYKIRIAYLSLWQKLRGWKII